MRVTLRVTFAKVIFSLAVFINFSFSQICSEILDNPDSFFQNELNSALIEKDTNCLEIAKNLESLRDLAFEIRGISVDCDGFEAIKFQQNFQFKILKALFSPEIYKLSLDDAKTSDERVNANRDYFQIWSYQSLYNREKFSEFNSLYQVAVPMLVDFYKQSYDYDSAIFYANRVANEYLNAAVGAYKTRPKLSELERLMLNPAFDKNELISLLYTKKPSAFELTNALKMGILQGRDSEFLSVFIRWGAELNSGHENTLFFALKSPEMLNFLLKNGANINYQNSFGKTALFYAAEFRDEKLVKFLLENEANLNLKIISNYEKNAISSMGSSYLPFNLCALNRTSKSTLMHAAKYSDLNIVKILVKNGAKLDEKDDMGFGVLDYAAENSDIRVYEYLKNLETKEILER